MHKILEQAIEILEKLEQYQHDAFFVGGCVRDSLLKKEMKDVDIATSATPAEVMEIFQSVIPVGIEHGTVIVRYKEKSYEVTTFRCETGYSDQRHPDEVVFITDIQEDLARRDFTINAMAMDRHGKLLDPFSGQADLQAKTIRTVGPPEERFKEDSLRIVRALRFSSQLGFSIDIDTLKQMNALKYQLDNVSVERITVEMSKFFQGESIAIGQAYLKQTNIVMYLPVFKENPKLIDSLPPLITPFLSFAEVIAFFHLLNHQYTVDTWIKAWKCSNKEKAISKKLVDMIYYMKQHSLDNWVVYQLKEAYIPMFVHLISCVLPEISVTTTEIIKWKKTLPIHGREDLCINGRYITALFMNHKKGAWIGEMINQIEYHIVMGNLKNIKSDIKEWILCHPPVKN